MQSCSQAIAELTGVFSCITIIKVKSRNSKVTIALQDSASFEVVECFNRLLTQSSKYFLYLMLQNIDSQNQKAFQKFIKFKKSKKE
jgi:hypothetical protein